MITKLANSACLFSSIIILATLNTTTIGLATNIGISQSIDIERSQLMPTQPLTTFELAQSQYSTLKLGDSGPAVSQLQENLKKLDIYKQAIHGRYDKQTKAAVSRFQDWYNLKVTGIADQQTQAEIDKALRCGITKGYYAAIVPSSNDIHLEIAQTLGISPKKICQGRSNRGSYFRVWGQSSNYHTIHGNYDSLRAAGFNARIIRY